MHLELSKHVLGKKITPHYYSSDLKKEKKTKEIHNQKKKYTASRKEKEMEMKASQRKQFPSWVLKREYTWSKPNQANRKSHPGKEHQFNSHGITEPQSQGVLLESLRYVYL